MNSKMTALLCALAVPFMLLSFHGSAKAEETSFIKAPVSVNYASTYWWRGVELNGKGVGVLWPSAGLAFGDTGLSLSVAAGINTDSIAVNEPGDRKSAKTFHETDYGVAWSTTIADLVTIGAGAMFINYYYHDAADPNAVDPSFYEGSLSLAVNTVLTPKIEAFYDYYIDRNGDNPRDEDYYLRFSVSQDLINAEGFKLTAGAWLGYYNNAYFDAVGFSDAGIKLGTSKDYKGVTFASSVNYARSLSNDFQKDYDANCDGRASKLRNHLWAEFGASCTL